MPRAGAVAVRGALVLLALSGSVPATGCGSAPPPDVVMIVTDTLRRDRVDAFGFERGLTPALDALAQRATVFRNAYSTSAWTSPAVASLFTSRLPAEHGIELFESVLADAEETLAERLAARGYATGGFSANWLIRSQLGYAQGFDRFENQRARGRGLRALSERAIHTAGRAVAWLDGLPAEPRAPFFLYLHLMDPHTPYAPLPQALERVFGAAELPDVERANDALWERGEPSQPMRVTLEKIYDAEVHSLDLALGLFLAVLEQKGRLENALVIVVADHGEELWERGMHGHGHALHDELIRVPLLVRVPGQTQARRVDDPVSLIDLAPTVLEAVGAPVCERFAGRSLWPQLTGAARKAAPARDTPVVSELINPPVLRRGPGHERALMLGDGKLIVDRDGTRHYFDRSLDPGERGSAAPSEALRRRLDAALERYLAGLEARPEARTLPLDDETRAELRALGYLE
jgi:arylsulfatase A-like enzyme